MALEERFDVALPDERIDNFRTVGDVLERLNEVLGSNIPVHSAEPQK